MIPAALRGTTSSAPLHVADWYYLNISLDRVPLLHPGALTYLVEQVRNDMQLGGRPS